MNERERRSIKIVLSGMDERSVTRMATIFRVVYKERCEVAAGEQADLAIVDLDGESGAWAAFRQEFPNLPAIVLSESPSSAEGAVYISKPVRLSLLWESVLRLVTGLPAPAFTARRERTPGDVKSDTAANSADNASQSIPSKPAQSMDLSSDVENAFNPDDYLLGHLLACLKECAGRECSISVQCGKGRQLVLFPHEGRVLSGLSTDQFERLSEVKGNEEFVLEISNDVVNSREATMHETDGLRFISIDYLLWNLAWCTARGRVPAGTDLSRLFYLRCWPNFPRLPQVLHGMRIASLWVGESRTLDDIATSLGIEKAGVYSFYSAAVTTGLAGLARRQVDGLFEPRNTTIKRDVVNRDVRNAILRHIDNS